MNKVHPPMVAIKKDKHRLIKILAAQTNKKVKEVVDEALELYLSVKLKAQP